VHSSSAGQVACERVWKKLDIEAKWLQVGGDQGFLSSLWDLLRELGDILPDLQAPCFERNFQ
jgi:hypothetical protein